MRPYPRLSGLLPFPRRDALELCYPGFGRTGVYVECQRSTLMQQAVFAGCIRIQQNLFNEILHAAGIINSQHAALVIPPENQVGNVVSNEGTVSIDERLNF